MTEGQDYNNEEFCYICFEGVTRTPEGEIEPLVQVCRCPTRVHRRCVARWQLYSAGKREEKSCRFCQGTLPDWKEVLTPRALPPAVPVLSIYYNNSCCRMKVRPGPDGLQAFLRQLEMIVGRDVANVNFVFRCRCPDTGAEIFLQGLQAFEAAMHCACVRAAQRSLQQQQHQQLLLQQQQHQPRAPHLGHEQQQLDSRSQLPVPLPTPLSHQQQRAVREPRLPHHDRVGHQLLLEAQYGGQQAASGQSPQRRRASAPEGRVFAEEMDDVTPLSPPPAAPQHPAPQQQEPMDTARGSVRCPASTVPAAQDQGMWQPGHSLVQRQLQRPEEMRGVMMANFSGGGRVGVTGQLSLGARAAGAVHVATQSVQSVCGVGDLRPLVPADSDGAAGFGDTGSRAHEPSTPVGFAQPSQIRAHAMQLPRGSGTISGAGSSRVLAASDASPFAAVLASGSGTAPVLPHRVSPVSLASRSGVVRPTTLASSSDVVAVPLSSPASSPAADAGDQCALSPVDNRTHPMGPQTDIRPSRHIHLYHSAPTANPVRSRNAVAARGTRPMPPSPESVTAAAFVVNGVNRASSVAGGTTAPSAGNAAGLEAVKAVEATGAPAGARDLPVQVAGCDVAGQAVSGDVSRKGKASAASKVLAALTSVKGLRALFAKRSARGGVSSSSAVRP